METSLFPVQEKTKAVFNWSGGKDSALALQMVLKEKEFDVVSLLTTMDEETGSSSVHGIPLGILRQQADSIGIPLFLVSMDKGLKNYRQKMREAAEHFKTINVTHFIFGDIFPEDMKSHRERNLHPEGIIVVEPLWNKSSEEVMEAFLQSGIKAKIIVAHADKLGRKFIGKDLNHKLVASFPSGIDICGEFGEYHTIAYAGDLFKKELQFSIGEVRNISYHITLQSGETQKFEFWQAALIDDRNY